MNDQLFLLCNYLVPFQTSVANTNIENSSMSGNFNTQIVRKKLEIYWDGHLKTQCDLINNICYERGIKRQHLKPVNSRWSHLLA